MATKRRKSKTAKQTGLRKATKIKQPSIQGVSVKQHLRHLMRDLSDKQLIAIASQSSDTQVLTQARKLCVEKGLKFTPTTVEVDQGRTAKSLRKKLNGLTLHHPDPTERQKVERKLRKKETAKRAEVTIKKNLQKYRPTSSPFTNESSDFLHPMSEEYGMPEYDLE